MIPTTKCSAHSAITCGLVILRAPQLHLRMFITLFILRLEETWVICLNWTIHPSIQRSGFITGTPLFTPRFQPHQILIGNQFADVSLLKSNVDRLFAIWQAINPTSYTIDETTETGNFVTVAGSVETSSTPLTPFVDASGSNYWTAETVRQTETFNYAYPETQRWAFGSDSDYQNGVADAVQQLYGGLSNQFSGEEAVNLMSVRPSAAAVTPVNQETGEIIHTNGSGHLHTNEAASVPAQKPVADEGFHPFHHLAERIKDAVHNHGHPDQAERGALDLEKEIGKRMLPPSSTFHSRLTANQHHLQHLRNHALTPNISSTSKHLSTFWAKPTACTSSLGNFTAIPGPGTHKTHLLAPLQCLVRRRRQEVRTRRNVANARLMPRPIQSSLAPYLLLHRLSP